MSRTVRPVALIAAAVCSWGVMGCSDDAQPSESDDGVPSVDEVASSWGEIAPRDERRSRAYLAGRGGSLLAYADFAAKLPERLDDAAYADTCVDLRADWDDSYPPRPMLDWLRALPDPILGRLWTSQIPAAETALQTCADGDEDRSAEAAEQVAVLQELVDRRLDELGVER
jgi:hypothetical protein